MELHVLADAISTYLRTLSKETRNIFVCRYYFMDSIREISAYSGNSESKIKSMLYRTRIGLKNYLEREGFTLLDRKRSVTPWDCSMMKWLWKPTDSGKKGGIRSFHG